MKINDIMSDYTRWDDLCPFINKELGITYSHRGVHPQHNGLGIGGRLPYSISEAEFNFMKDYIIKHDLKKGFDLATGTGISTVAIGWALKQTGGNLLSVDSYIEEKTQGFACPPELGNEGPYENNKKLMSLFDLDNVHLERGVAPDDCVKYMEKYQMAPLDFAFLDCPKDASGFVRDITYIKEYLNKDKFAIFWHDTHCFMPDFKRLSLEYLDIESIQIHEFIFSSGTQHQTFPLSLITNIGNEE
jgi:hypothetical protein